MFAKLFKRSKKQTPKEKMEESLLQLQDALSDHEIVLYIRNHIAYIENFDEDIEYITRGGKIKVESENITLKIESYPSFTDIQELIFTFHEFLPSRSSNVMRAVNFNSEYIFTCDIEESTFRNGNRTTTKRNREDRSFIGDEMIYRCNLRELREEVKDRQFTWYDHRVYFLDGTKGIKKVSKSAPRFEGKSITHPEIALEPYYAFTEVYNVDQMSFHSRKNWTEPSESPIDLNKYKSKLEDFKNRLDKEKAHELLLEKIESEAMQDK